mgnify:CR=1 FL=1
MLGYPLAYVLSQLPPRVANLCMIGVLMPFWTSILVRTYAWLVLLQRQGLINTWGIKLGLWDQPLTLVHNLNGTLIGMVQMFSNMSDPSKLGPFMAVALLATETFIISTVDSLITKRPTTAFSIRASAQLLSLRLRKWPV